MIDSVLTLLRSELNEHLMRQTDIAPADGVEDRVVFPNGEKGEPEFRLGAVTVLLTRLEEETTLRPADRYLAVAPDGTQYRVQPTVQLNLFVLFVARHKLYEQSLKALSQVIRWFQQRRVLDSSNTLALDPAIERITLELVTLPFGEQNDMWSTLGGGYYPSALFRVRLVAFADAAGHAAVPITEASRNLVRRELADAG
jgi:hypothetical protein